MCSLRFYRTDPGSSDFTTGVVCLNYPQETQVLDIMELHPKAKQWVNTTSQNMGNWVSREAVIQKLEALKIVSVPVSRGELPIELLNDLLNDNRELVVVGFDMLQVPKCKIQFSIKN